jgi:hypothetical protein
MLELIGILFPSGSVEGSFLILEMSRHIPVNIEDKWKKSTYIER